MVEACNGSLRVELHGRSAMVEASWWALRAGSFVVEAS